MPALRQALLFLLAIAAVHAQALQEAARTGDIARLQTLLGKGVDINAVNDQHRTALIEAVHNGRLEAMKVLLKAGADPEAADDRSRGPMAFAMDYPDRNVAAEMAGLLMRARLDVPRESDQWTLHYAAARGEISVAEMLLGLGSDVNAVGTNGNRPLDLACLKGNAPLVKLLIAHGAQVNARNKDGVTALHNAALGGNPDVASLLLTAGAEIDARDQESDATPLYYAVSLSRTELARYLIGKGASVTVTTKTGKTILQAAIDNHLSDIADLLRR